MIERERPDALLPTLGGQTALNLAKALHDDGTLERFGVELIGADYEAIHRAEDREAFRTTMEEAGLRVPWSLIVESVGEAERGARRRRDQAAGDRPARRSRWAARAAASAATETELAPGRLRGARREPDQPGAGRGVGARLGRVRARGDARPQRQRRDHLLDRERRPDGRPHRRLGHGRAGADAHRPRSTRSCATRRSR